MMIKTNFGNFIDVLDKVLKDKTEKERKNFFKLENNHLSSVLCRMTDIFTLLRNKVSVTVVDHELENLILEQIALNMDEDNLLVHILNEYEHAYPSVHSWKKIYTRHYASPLMSVVKEIQKKISKFKELGMYTDEYVFDLDILCSMIRMYQINISSMNMDKDDVRGYLERAHSMINRVCKSPINGFEFVNYVLGKTDIREDFPEIK